jgi:hypothetical protein
VRRNALLVSVHRRRRVPLDSQAERREALLLEQVVANLQCGRDLRTDGIRQIRVEVDVDAPQRGWRW